MNVKVKTLIQAMALKKFNQNQLAKRSGVSRNTINGMLKGKKTTNIDTLGKIATALEISPLELIDADN
ncbi:helix-turn-helix domain-containing protein [uncultured Acidaminococcus sp.]|uniref:helix-turn-helix domain-containing protein n=1 Tax=uncultured Acidaminococcus sp. TaxID=352152 RepID=UPI002598D93C|nr:helix-turn-helix transcriptional regulator [uncultured Acidaminococcus sp.]